MHERLQVRVSELGPREAPITSRASHPVLMRMVGSSAQAAFANFAERTYSDVTRAWRRSSRHTTRLPCSKSKPHTKPAVSDFVQGLRISCQGLRANAYIGVRDSSSSFGSHVQAPDMAPGGGCQRRQARAHRRCADVSKCSKSQHTTIGQKRVAQVREHRQYRSSKRLPTPLAGHGS